MTYPDPLPLGIAEILQGRNLAIGPSHRWEPVIGEEAALVVRRQLATSEEQAEVLASARDVLATCLPAATEGGTHTGLVMGYVQSGKTLSFTTVAALAHDNAFRLVIVLSGATRELADQSRDRLLADLGILERPFAPWQPFHNPRVGEAEAIRNTLATWSDPVVPSSQRPTVLVTLLKNHQNLRHLTALLQQLGSHVDVPALIIDDEADQASLNNRVRQGEFSTTYQRVLNLRARLPRHSYLQYTATPQAPLLISILDELSPQSAVVLNPGADYVGGRELMPPRSPYVEVIPDNEIPDRDHPFDDPPETLKRSLRLFFIGVASGFLRRDGRPRNRSMMVHPSRLVASHQHYTRWVRAIRTLWVDTLTGQLGPEDRSSLLDEFRREWQDLRATEADLENFEELAQFLPHALREARIQEVNSQAEVRGIQWGRCYAWILIGGQVLDRGFTVEGLTVSYMPRGPGVGNADTLQQRARFFGYKRPYLGFCRIFLEAEVRDAYWEYTRHEQELRDHLAAFAESGRPLAEFRRVFLLDPTLEPTRRAVFDTDYQRLRLQGGWHVPLIPPSSQEVAESNRRLVSTFMHPLESDLVPWPGDDRRTEIQSHSYLQGISLKDMYETLLAEYRPGNDADTARWVIMLAGIAVILTAEPGATATIVRISNGKIRTRSCESTTHHISNLLQGAAPPRDTATTRQGEIYPGDRQIYTEDEVTVQVHTITFFRGPISDGRLLIREAPILAVHLPEGVIEHILFQPQVTNDII